MKIIFGLFFIFGLQALADDGLTAVQAFDSPESVQPTADLTSQTWFCYQQPIPTDTFDNLLGYLVDHYEVSVRFSTNNVEAHDLLSTDGGYWGEHNFSENSADKALESSVEIAADKNGVSQMTSYRLIRQYSDYLIVQDSFGKGPEPQARTVTATRKCISTIQISQLLNSFCTNHPVSDTSFYNQALADLASVHSETAGEGADFTADFEPTVDGFPTKTKPETATEVKDKAIGSVKSSCTGSAVTAASP